MAFMFPPSRASQSQAPSQMPMQAPAANSAAPFPPKKKSAGKPNQSTRLAAVMKGLKK